MAAGPTLSAVEFDAELAGAGVTAGIVAEAHALISAAIVEPSFECNDELIGVGYDAVPSTDARLEANFSEGLQAWHRRDDGSVDYHDRELLKPVHQGDALAIVHLPIAGTEGQRVDGTRIPVTAPRTLAVKLGNGAELYSDQVIRATRDGVILYKAGQSLDVVDRHHHQGPVDLHSGSLNMQGSLVVAGDVLRTFSVTATGDVEILGNVDCATVQAGGNLRVRGGVRGGDGGAACTDGDLWAHHAESADLHAGGVLRLAEAVNSQLEASEIHVSGRVRSGIATAEQHIVVKEAGAPNGVETRLTAGEPLESPVAQAQRLIGAAKAMRQSVRVRGRSSERTKSGKTGRAKAELDAAEVQRLRERAKRREQLLETASIQLSLAHPGVSIHIGDQRLTLDEPVRTTRYSLDRDSATLRAEKTPQ